MCKNGAGTLPSNVKEHLIDLTKPKSYPIVSVQQPSVFKI